MIVSSNVPVFIINMDSDEARRETILDQFASLPGFDLHIVSGVVGSAIPGVAGKRLVENQLWAETMKGTIGCFLSHVSAWEQAARSEQPFALIIEDDVDLKHLHLISQIDFPETAELIFVNDRMCPPADRSRGLRTVRIIESLRNLDRLKAGPGGDGYLVSPAAAGKLLDACARDLYFGHVDGRLLRYATTEDDLALVGESSWIGTVVRRHHSVATPPALGILDSWALSAPLITHGASPSSGDLLDRSTSVAQLVSPRSVSSRGPSSPAGVPGWSDCVPIRYWNRIHNIGDAINPYVIEAVSGRRPFYTYDEHAEHVLGVGSVLFMATQSSKIWGSGILDPTAPCPLLGVNNVRAVRGTMTRDIIRRECGLSAEIALGDPGVFVDEVPEVSEMLRKVSVTHAAAVIPHHALVNHPYFKALERNADCKILDPRTSNMDFIKSILSAEILVTQSLHGMVFAEALNKPYVWISHSVDDLWLFKFRDWLTNTFEPSRVPLSLETPFELLRQDARLSGLALDRQALRHAFPEIRSVSRSSLYGFRQCRAMKPFTFHVVSEGSKQATHPSMTLIEIRSRDGHALRQALNAFAQKCDDLFTAILVFDRSFYELMKIEDLSEILDILDSNVECHFIQCVPPRDALRSAQSLPIPGARFRAVPWMADFAWSGFTVIRHAIDFSFDSPGMAVLDSPSGGSVKLPEASLASYP